MKKILISLVTIITAGSLIFATTHAVWTHSVSVKGSTITTGSADLQIAVKETEPSESDWNSKEQNSSLTLGGLVPGYSWSGVSKKSYAFSLKNNSSSDITFSLSSIISGVNFSNVDVDQTKLLIRIIDQDGEVDPDTGQKPASPWKSLIEWQIEYIPWEIYLLKGQTKRFWIEARLDIEAGDERQDQNITFGFDIKGEQI